MKKAKEKKAAKRANVEAIAMKTTFNTTSIANVYIIFNVKDKTNVWFKLLQKKMN